MAQPPHTMQLAGRADWALMIAIHDALRRDLDQLLHATAGHASARARWTAFRSQLRFHLAAEHAAMWPNQRCGLWSSGTPSALMAVSIPISGSRSAPTPARPAGRQPRPSLSARPAPCAATA
jgi:hypothetical protein